MNPLTPLELLDIIEREYGFESPALRQHLTELEELKRDVKRYFETKDYANFPYYGNFEEFENAMIEHCSLRDKLSKVGN
jgi:hypothetical protein